MSRWVRLTLMANGITQDMTLEDAIGVCAILTYTGRTIPLREFDEKSLHLWHRQQNNRNF